jgi:hypothetical protein
LALFTFFVAAMRVFSFEKAPRERLGITLHR